jgi:uncharacterized membrane protein YjjB (DUF3815 family)
VFAAFKFIGTFLLACVSIVAGIVESGHPLLFGTACAAFVIGIVGAEIFRVYRSRSVRSSIR